VRADSKAVRIECRVGGADLNPYLAFAALLAAGIDGVENSLEPEKPFKATPITPSACARSPRRLREATDLMDKLAHAAPGLRRRRHRPLCAHRPLGAVEYDRRVTDWEIKRGFEQY
jgi:glutamine synthetase